MSALKATEDRIALARGVAAGHVTDHGWKKGHITWQKADVVTVTVTGRVAAFRKAGLLEPPAVNGVKPPYPVRLNAAGEAWLAKHSGMCVRCLTVAATGKCCSSHGKKLCHACYRRTHYVEVCVEGCPLCAAESLPILLSPSAVGGKPKAPSEESSDLQSEARAVLREDGESR